ncbi:MAG TPA: LytR C-terminal domain-containing protein [Gemmatimonadales bacterium]|nr:LytR C-terminal domain-containing protein [Gemmatimonadales bacterium]
MIVCAAALTACRNDRGSGAGANTLPIPGERGPHITVEVLNASGKPGLARVGTRVLRRAGIDVLTFGNATEGTGALDSTRIIVRRGGTDLAKRVRAALGIGRVVVQLDSSRLLDASVYLGADFAPTSLEFHP